MAKNNAPVFELVPRIEQVALTAANAARDGSGTVTSLVTGVADGTRIDAITFTSAQATAAANSANVGRVFLSIDSGTTWRLFDEIAIAAVTASNTAIGARNRLTYPQGIILKDTTHRIGVTIAVRAGAQDDHHVVAQGGDLGA